MVVVAELNQVRRPFPVHKLNLELEDEGLHVLQELNCLRLQLLCSDLGADNRVQEADLAGHICSPVLWEAFNDGWQ